jgi:membrane-associated protease RseP (regulator of RpoE activity)
MKTDAGTTRPVPTGPRLLLAATCTLLAAACGTAAHAAPPTPPTPPRPPRVMILDPGGRGASVLTVPRGHLGVELVDITPELREHFGAPRDAGVLVARVLPDGPAARAGVRVGDVITAVDGQKVGDDSDLRRSIRDKKDKEVAALEVMRNRARQTINAQVEQRATSELDLAGVIGPRGQRVIVDPERINRLVDRAMRLQGPDMQQRLEHRREIEERLQRRTEALEQRLERLEKELKDKEDRANKK